MNTLFTQTATHNVDSNVSSDLFEKFPEMILKHTDWEYSCQQKDDGCILKPTFKNMPYRNSFVPEIDVTVSYNDAQTILQITGRPVKSIRVFTALWFGFVAAFEIFLLIFTIATDLGSIVPLFIPIVMFLLGYLVCDLGTRATFNSVVNAIRKECL